MNLEEFDMLNVSGTMVSYYFTCKRKLWLFAKNIDMEQSQPTTDLIIGKLLNFERFKRERHKEIEIEDCVIDFLTFRGEIIVHETKKSKKFEEAHVWQTKYYMFVLRKYGLNVNHGVIHYPKLMRKLEVNFEDGDEEKIQNALIEIKQMVSSKIPPPVLNRSFCKKCSYYELCYV
jgi:CRISPR-associated exonuclease Cas4